MDALRDIVMRKGDQMIMLINGALLVMENDMVTSEGVQIRTDGTIILPDGTVDQLVEDEALVIDRVLSQLMEG